MAIWPQQWGEFRVIQLGTLLVLDRERNVSSLKSFCSEIRER